MSRERRIADNSTAEGLRLMGVFYELGESTPGFGVWVVLCFLLRGRRGLTV